MIKVELEKKDKNIIGFKMTGHAEYADYGQDIVCAAASMLAYNTVDTFTDLLNIKGKFYFDIPENGNLAELHITDKLHGREFEDAQLILRKFELGVKSLKTSYSDYIELDYTEV